MRYTICHWATNRTDPQNLLSTTLDVPLHIAVCSSWFNASLSGLGAHSPAVWEGPVRDFKGSPTLSSVVSSPDSSPGSKEVRH